MKTALVEARIPVYNNLKKDYSDSRIDLYFISDKGYITNETGGCNVKNCESFGAAKEWLKTFISWQLRGEIISIVEG